MSALIDSHHGLFRFPERYRHSDAGGFTLIEIVSVLVILGILAAVAAPKYFDLTETSEKDAAMASVAEAQARMEAHFGKRLLEGMSCAQARAYATDIGALSDTGKTGPSGAFGDFTLEGGPWAVFAQKGQITVSKTKDGWTLSSALILPNCDLENKAVALSDLGVVNIREGLWHTDEKSKGPRDWVTTTSNPEDKNHLAAWSSDNHEGMSIAFGSEAEMTRPLSLDKGVYELTLDKFDNLELMKYKLGAICVGCTQLKEGSTFNFSSSTGTTCLGMSCATDNYINTTSQKIDGNWVKDGVSQVLRFEVGENGAVLGLNIKNKDKLGPTISADDQPKLAELFKSNLKLKKVSD